MPPRGHRRGSVLQLVARAARVFEAALEAGKKRLAGDTGRQATSGEVKGLRQEMRDLKELVAELSLENRLLKKT